MKTSKTYKIGDVVQVDLNPTIGHEKKKIRPCLVIEEGASALQLIIVLPITEAKAKHQSEIFVPIDDLPKAGLTKKSVIDCYQIRNISLKRVLKKLGNVDQALMNAVKNRLALILDIGHEHIEY